MNKNKLFPQINGILHGGDYNAEQWLDRPDSGKGYRDDEGGRNDFRHSWSFLLVSLRTY